VYAESGFPVDFQLKGTTAAEFHADHIRYDLWVRNFNLIVTRPRTAIPYYLFLVCFSSQEEDWIAVEDERLVLGASAFWWTSLGARSQNAASVRLRIPIGNRLTSSAIDDIMTKARAEYRL
jgi:hypothetical protein